MGPGRLAAGPVSGTASALKLQASGPSSLPSPPADERLAAAGVGCVWAAAMPTPTKAATTAGTASNILMHMDGFLTIGKSLPDPVGPIACGLAAVKINRGDHAEPLGTLKTWLSML